VTDSLLRWYPEPYRSERGPEILGVLMDAGGPTPRERWALMLGGLRMRAGAHGNPWRPALRTAALMLLVLKILNEVDTMVAFRTGPDAAMIARIVLSLIGIVALTHNGFLAAAAAAVAMIAVDGGDLHLTRLYSPWLVLLLVVPLIGRGPVSVPRSLHYLVGWTLLPAGITIAGSALTDNGWPNAAERTWWVLFAVAALWAVVDERLVLTVGLVLLYEVVFRIPFAVELARQGEFARGWVLWIGLGLVVPVLGVTTGGVLTRRRVRT